MRLRSFLFGALAGGLVVWLWKDEIRDWVEAQVEDARVRAADRIHAVEETAEEALDRAAAPLRRAEEALEEGKSRLRAGLRAAEDTIRPA